MSFDTDKVTPEQLRDIFLEAPSGAWVVVDLKEEGPRIVATSETERSARAFAQARGGIVLEVPSRRPSKQEANHCTVPEDTTKSF